MSDHDEVVSPGPAAARQRSSAAAGRDPFARAAAWIEPRLPRTRRGVAVAWAVLFGLNCLAVLRWLAIKYPDVDLGEMLFQLGRLRAGYVPYRDTFTHHFLGYVLPFYGVSLLTPVTPFVLKLLQVGFNFVTALCVYGILREVSRPAIAWLGGFLAVTAGWFWGWAGYAFNVQSYIVPVLALYYLFIVRASMRGARDAFWASGFLAGLLLTYDQRCLAFLPLLIVPPLAAPRLRGWRAGAGALAGVVCMPVLLAGYLLAHGAWSDFVLQTFTFPMHYRNRGMPGTTPLAALRALLAGLGQEKIASGLALVALALLCARERRRWLSLALLLMSAGAAAFAVAGGRMFVNYYLVFAPSVLLLLALLPVYVPWGNAGRWLAASVLVLCGLAFEGKAVLAYWLGRSSAPAREATLEAAASYIRSRTDPHEPVLVWGFAPQIYVLSNHYQTFRDAGLLSVAGANFISYSEQDQGRLPGMVAEFHRFLVETPPRVIVVYALHNWDWPCYRMGMPQSNLDYNRATYLSELRDMLQSDYRLAQKLHGTCDHAEIFERVSPAQPRT